MENCTELYVPDIEGDRHGNSLDWEHVTLYSNIEPCPMCSQAIIWRGMREGGRGEKGDRGERRDGEMQRRIFPPSFLSSSLLVLTLL